MGKDDIVLLVSSLITLIAIGVSLVMVNQLAEEIADIGESSLRDLKQFKVDTLSLSFTGFIIYISILP